MTLIKTGWRHRHVAEVANDEDVILRSGGQVCPAFNRSYAAERRVKYSNAYENACCRE